MTKFLLISEDSGKIETVNKVFSSDEIIPCTDETMIFDVLKVEEPDVVIIDGDIDKFDLKPLCRKIKSFPVVSLLIIGEKEY